LEAAEGCVAAVIDLVLYLADVRWVFGGSGVECLFVRLEEIAAAENQSWGLSKKRHWKIFMQVCVGKRDYAYFQGQPYSATYA
jgi:hypothetical protein